ncbi:hypothetical protein J7S33_19260 [Saccharothrix algeriensis]|uniref:Uncharacterized protein n=1 Tax=Saccharothrix algeriensis TaxID=173560 RepID=A0A8T8HT45_9PSEU|nr:hypothetical protein J7S33_19260 [Saccharothrix algeriensis]
MNGTGLFAVRGGQAPSAARSSSSTFRLSFLGPFFRVRRCGRGSAVGGGGGVGEPPPRISSANLANGLVQLAADAELGLLVAPAHHGGQGVGVGPGGQRALHLRDAPLHDAGQVAEAGREVVLHRVQAGGHRVQARGDLLQALRQRFEAVGRVDLLAGLVQRRVQRLAGLVQLAVHGAARVGQGRREGLAGVGDRAGEGVAGLGQRTGQLLAGVRQRGGQRVARAVEVVAGLVQPAVQARRRVGHGALQRLAGAVEVLVHALVDLVEATAQRGLQRLDALPQRCGHRGRHGVDLAVLLVQVQFQVVQPLVDVGELVLQAVHPPGDALEAAGDAVQPPVELGERRGEPVDQPVDRPADALDRGVLRLQPRQRLVQPLGQHADLGPVGQLGQALANGTQRLQRGHPRVDLVQCIEDLLLFALTDLRGARQHVAHPIEGHRGVVVLVHGLNAFVQGRGDLRQPNPVGARGCTTPRRASPVLRLLLLHSGYPTRRYPKVTLGAALSAQGDHRPSE